MPEGAKWGTRQWYAAVDAYMAANPTSAGIVGETIDYNYNNTITSPPASQQFRLNNADPSLATHVFVSTTAANGAGVTNFLGAFKTGGHFAFQDFDDDTKYHEYNISGTPVNNTTWFDFPVTWIKGTGVFNNNQKTPMIIYSFG